MEDMTSIATMVAAKRTRQSMSLHYLLASLIGPCSTSEYPVSFLFSSF